MQVGDDLADIETEKITGTLEAADAGTVRRIVAQVGEDVPVGHDRADRPDAEVSDDALDAAVLQARAVIDAGMPEDAGGGAEGLQTADVGGRKVSYAGAGQDGDVILLVHGYGGDRNSWLFLQRAGREVPGVRAGPARPRHLGQGRLGTARSACWPTR